MVPNVPNNSVTFVQDIPNAPQHIATCLTFKLKLNHVGELFSTGGNAGAEAGKEVDLILRLPDHIAVGIILRFVSRWCA